MTNRHSELEEIHRELGAGLDDWNGMQVAWSYATDPCDEHDAVREAAGLFDVSGLKKIWITGPDAFAVVNHVITRDMSKIDVGQSAYGSVLTDQGTITDDAIAFCLASDRYLYVHGSGRSLECLQKSAEGKNVKLNFDDDLHDISLQGPKAVDLLDPHTPINLRKLKYFHQDETTLFGKRVILSRTGYSGERGYEIFCDRADVAELWRRILEVGGPEGVLPCSFTCLDKIRIEAALLFYPYDMDERFTPWEVGLDWTLSKRGDYRGKEAAFATKGKEKVNVVGISAKIEEDLEGEAILLKDGEPVGCVNSPAYSHRMKKSLALVHVKPDVAHIGTVLTYSLNGTELSVQIERTPFYDPEKTRPHEED